MFKIVGGEEVSGLKMTGKFAGILLIESLGPCHGLK
jgi:hypothetical protein